MLKLETFDEAVEQARVKRSKLIVINNKASIHAELTSCPSLNLNEKLSELLLAIPIKERRVRITSLVEDLVMAFEGESVLVSGLNVLFDRSLEVDPLRLLTNCAKKKVLLVDWPGRIGESSLSYASPDHAEYREYKGSGITDLILFG